MKAPHNHTTAGKVVLLLATAILPVTAFPASPGEPINLWAHAPKLNDIIFSSPAIGPSGTVVFGTKNDDNFNPSGNVYGYNPKGSIKWKYPLTTGPDWFEGSPAISADGTAYIGCWNNYLYAIDVESDFVGNEFWRFNASTPASAGGQNFDGAIIASPTIGPDGTVYVGSMNGFIFAIDANGQEIWDTDMLSPVLAGAVLNEAADTLYFGDGDGNFHALDAVNGEVLWTYSVPPEHDLINRPEERGIEATPVLDGQGNILFSSVNGYLYMLSPDGVLKSTYAASDSILSSPVIDADGKIYFSSRDTYLYCLQVSTEGVLDILWELSIGDVLYSSPAIDDTGRVIVAAYSGGSTSGDTTSVYCFDGDGQSQWQPVEIPTLNDSSINISPDGTFYIGGYDGNMYKFQGFAPLAMEGWPRQAASRRQTGLVADIQAIDLYDYFPDITESLGGLSLVPWFGAGWIEATQLPDIEHIDHGKLYVAYSDASGIIFWDYLLGRWLVAFRSHPNYLWDSRSGCWLYHAEGTSVDTERWFFDFSIRDWVTVP